MGQFQEKAPPGVFTSEWWNEMLDGIETAHGIDTGPTDPHDASNFPPDCVHLVAVAKEKNNFVGKIDQDTDQTALPAGAVTNMEFHYVVRKKCTLEDVYFAAQVVAGAPMPKLQLYRITETGNVTVTTNQLIAAPLTGYLGSIYAGQEDYLPGDVLFVAADVAGGGNLEKPSVAMHFTTEHSK